jgi:serine/threonine protein kinase
MGAVWLGQDEVLGREVALKRVGVAPGGGSPDLERAEREARLAARLNHPHVVAVYDLVTEDHEQWLVMEYVEGSTLAALVARDGALSPDQAATVLGQVADALAAAHAAGIVHRDVKPSNILVAPDGQVKLSDFGIARAEADASLTQTGLVTGSPAYLSPEVASGQQATDASDVWSLGATLYHALAGHPPYEIGDNLLGALYRIVHEEPPRLPSAGWLAPLLEATMCHEPAERWSMAEVRRFLVAGPSRPVRPSPRRAPVAAEPEPTQLLSRAVPPVAGTRKRRGSALPVALVVVAVVVVAALGWLAFTFGDNGDPDGGPSSASSKPSGRDSSSSGATPEVTAAGMEAFVEEYLATVTSDPKEAWDDLTPAFQEQSGNFGQYQGFWKTIESAQVMSVTADPDSRQVMYTVEYVRDDGSSTTDEVTLRLEGTDDGYLIAAET